MELKKREEIIKDLDALIDECGKIKGAHHPYITMKNTIALIKELTEEIRDLETDYDRVYEQAAADIHGNMTDGGTSCHWCMDKTKADTVKRMQDALHQRIDITLDVFDFNISECNAIRQALRGVKNDIDQVAKELLEENK